MEEKNETVTAEETLRTPEPRAAGGHSQIAIITGASSGIGREFARQIDRLKEVDEIWIIARGLKKLDETREELDTPVVQFPLDLTKKESFDNIREALLRQMPIVKYLVNAAGYGKFGSTTELTLEESEGIIELNDRALVTMTGLAVPYMVGGSHILHMGSISAYMPLPDFAAYAASKAFVVSYSYAQRAELKPKGITVTAVCPFWVKTAFFDRVANANATRIPEKYRFMSSPDHVVKKALKAAKKNKPVSINRPAAKCLHVAAKLLPKRVVIALWRGMQKRQRSEKEAKI
ncbi:MAG: SDR family NAD(P)-dependent oxidoreductase [Clostridiales bacterium]|jgi:short-subunit dehydrogenase|nr:SDR family NAD(P)-dependent oxidoreductase [Clostridiales bacterium]